MAEFSRRRITGKRTSPVSIVQPNAIADDGKRSRTAAEPVKPILALVVNLKRRPDRWEAVKQRLAPFEEQGLLQVRRFVATDGLKDEVSEAEVSRTWSNESNARYDARPGLRKGVSLEMTPGERGCAHSHVRAWREVAAGSAPVLVIEDDAVVLQDDGFGPKLRKRSAQAAAAGADLMYLGYIQGAPWRRQVSPGLWEAEYMWTTVCYMLWPEGARKLLATLPIAEPIDNFMASHMSSGRVCALAVSPPLVDQEQEWDQGSDVPHSDDAAFADVG